LDGTETGRAGVAVVTRRVKWMASVGLVAALGIGTAGGFATSAAARTKPKPVNTAAAADPVTTASFNFKVSVSGIAKKLGTITLTGSGEVDLVNDAGSLSVTLPASVAKLIPGGSGGPEMINAVLSGGTVYVEVPALATLLGEPWISIALPSSATTAIPGIFTKVGGALGDVDEILAFARSHHASVHALGPSMVDGTSVTGSRVTAHLKAVKIAATLWANSSGQLVQAKLAAGHRALGISAVVNFSSYDAPVTITVPPPSEVKAIPLSVITTVLGGLLNHAQLGKHGGKTT
jgi:hypothetical protein